MNTIAKSLIIAIRHIEFCPSNDPDADIVALEEIAFLLQSAPKEEISALAMAAKQQGVSDLLVQLGLVNV